MQNPRNQATPEVKDLPRQGHSVQWMNLEHIWIHICMNPARPQLVISSGLLIIFCFALLCFALLYFALPCFALLCIALLCFALHCYALLCIALLCLLFIALLCLSLLCMALLCFACHYFAGGTRLRRPKEPDLGRILKEPGVPTGQHSPAVALVFS